jgi:hypothetical protein
MMITVHLSDGRKITKDTSKLVFYNPLQCTGVLPDVQEGVININTIHVVDMRLADDIEKEHARIHGW